MPDRDDELYDDAPGTPDEGDARADASGADDAVGEDDGAPARNVAKVAIIVLLVIFGPLLIAILALQTRPGAMWAVEQIVKRANPYEDATITVDEVRGNWLSNLRLYGLRLTRKDGTAMAVIDTLEARYNLLALPGNRLHVREGRVAGAYLNFRQGPDRVFDISVPFLPDTLQIAADTLQQGLKLQLENITFARTNADFEFYNPRGDSILRLRDFELRMPLLSLTDTVSLDIDSLRTAYVLPRDAGRGTLRAGLRLQNDLLDVDGLRLVSTRSDLSASGRLRLPGDSTDTFSDVDFRLQARPLDFADLAPFLPMLNPRAVVTRADVRATGSGRFLRLNIDAATADSGRVNGRFALTPTAGDSVRYFAEGEVRRLDPFYFTGGEQLGQNRVSLDLTADLRGESLERVSGPLNVNLLQGRFGEFELERTTLAGTFIDGGLRLTATSDVRGAALRLAGQLWPFEREIRYNLNGRVRGLDLARFGGAQPSDLSGTLRLAGVGTTLDSARTDLRLDLDPSSLGRYRVVDGTISGRLVDGFLRFGGQVRTPEGFVSAAGDANLGGRTPSYRISEGRLENFDVAAFTGQDVSSNVNASFTAQGAGFDPETMNLRIEGSVANSSYGEYQIARANLSLIADGGFDPETMRLDADGRLEGFTFDRYRVDGADFTASLRAGRLALDTQAQANFGSLDVALAGRPFAGSQTLEIQRGRFVNLDLGALTGNPDQYSDLTGTLAGTITGFDPETMNANVRLTLDPSVYNAQEIQGARADLRLAGGTLRFDVDLDLPGGRSLLAGSARPFDEVISYRVDEGYVSNLDLRAFLNDPALETNLNGSIRLEGRGTDLRTMSLTADLGVGFARYNDVTVDSGRVQVTLDAGLANTTLRLFGGGGRLDLTGRGRFFDDVPTYRVRGTAAGIDVGRLVGQDTLGLYGSDLRFAFEGVGKDPRTMTLAGEVYGDSIRYRTIVVDTLGTRFRLAAGVVDVDTLALESNVANAGAGGRVAVWDSVSAASDFRLAGTLRSLAPLRPFLGATEIAAERGEITARLYGRPGDLRYEASGELFTLVYNTLRAADLDVRTAGRIKPGFTGLESGEVTADVGYLALPQFTIRQSSLQARLDSNTVTFDAVLDADDRRAANLTGRLDIRPEIQRLDFDAFTLRFDQDTWRLAAPATITYGERYRISNFLLTSGDQQLAIDGVVDPSVGGEQNLVMTVDGFRVGALADLFGYRGLDGRVSGTVDLTGPATEPNLTGTLALGVVSYGDSVGTVDLALRYDSLRLNTDALFRHRDGSTLRATGYIPLDLSLAAPGDTLGGEPGAGVAVRTAQAPASEEVNLRIEADSFAIGWIRPFLDRNTVRRLEGKLDGDLMVTGQLGAPLLGGEARLVRGLIELPQLGVTYRDLTADFVLAANNVNVTTLAMRSGGGTVTGSGRLALPDLTLGQFDLDLRLDNFELADNNDYSIRRVSGPVRVRGTTDRPRVEGEVQVLEADLFLTNTGNFEDVPLTREDVMNVETRFGIRVGADTTANEVFQNMALDLRVQLERDVWLRSTTTPQLDIQFTGGLEVRKASGDPDPQVYGDIEVIPQRSNIAALGRRFNLTTGTAQFNGPLTELFLDVVAEYTPRRPGSRENIATITLTARGRPLVPGDLALAFGSDPPMDTADILSYIATGRPADQALAFSGSGTAGGGLLDTGAGLALGQLASFIEGAAGRGLGLDVIEIEQEGTSGTRLTAGKYLSPRLYASISYPINYGNGDLSTTRQFTGQNVSVSLEYELQSWLLAVLGYENPRVRTSLRYDYSY